MNKKEDIGKLRMAIREEILRVLEENPDLFRETQRLDESFGSWWQSFKAKASGLFAKLGGAEAVVQEMESDPERWIVKILGMIKGTAPFKEMLAKVQEIVDQMEQGSPPATGLEPVMESRKELKDLLLEADLESRVAAKASRPGWAANLAAIMMIISLFTDKVLLMQDMWWIVICAGLVGYKIISKIMLDMARGKTNLQGAKMQMAQSAGLQPAQLQSYISTRTKK